MPEPNDFTGKLIKNTYQRVVQISGSATSSAEIPKLYDGLGNEIKGVQFQEAWERDVNGDVQPTTGPFFDIFWELDSDGNKQPKDIKWWMDSNFNLVMLPESE